MIKHILYLSIVGLLVFASVGFAQQYQVSYNGTVNNNTYTVDGLDVYISPYEGTITQNGVNVYKGPMICDDFVTDLTSSQQNGTPWSANATNTAALNGDEAFSNQSGYGAYDYGSNVYDTLQQDYNAAAYLATELLGLDLTDSTTYDSQVDLSLAIWEIFDPTLRGTAGSSGLGTVANPDPVQADINAAFIAVKNGPAYTNGYNSVDAFGPIPSGASQEFLVANGPAVSAPEPAAEAILGVDLLSALAGVFLLRRYRTRA